MNRRPIAILSTVSLLVLALWIRSYWWTDSWTHNWTNGTQTLRSLSGRIIYTRAQAAGVTATGTTTLSAPPAGFKTERIDPAAFGSFIEDHPFGFAYAHYADAWANQTTIMFPDLLFVLAGTVVPMLWVLHRRRKLRSGCCIQCGYDLRATPDRCPECGTVPRVSKLNRKSAQSRAV